MLSADSYSVLACYEHALAHALARSLHNFYAYNYHSEHHRQRHTNLLSSRTTI